MTTLLTTEETICGEDRDNNHVMSKGKLISDGIDCLQIIPNGYFRPPSERPRLNEVVFLDSIPLVDLQDLNGSARHTVIRNIKHACQQHGFFQIINHGVPETVIQRMLEVAREFFTMPAEYRSHLYSEDTSRVVHLSTSFNIQKEDVLNWGDYLRHHCYPLEDYIDSWPTKPSAYREVASKYCTEVRAMIIRLLAAISESLGLEPDFLNKALGNHGQHMAINNYPRCPNPELTYGLPSHTDPNALTALLQDQVSGLQVLNNGRRVAVQPIPYSYVVNIRDQLQIINHGVPETEIQRMLKEAREFFPMPAEYRSHLYSEDTSRVVRFRVHLYSEDTSRVVRLSTSFNIQKEDVLTWRDYLRHHCYELRSTRVNYEFYRPIFESSTSLSDEEIEEISKIFWLEEDELFCLEVPVIIDNFEDKFEELKPMLEGSIGWEDVKMV